MTTSPEPGARGLKLAGASVLSVVAAVGAVLSFQSLYLAATPVFGPGLAAGFPLLVDFLILGASLQYVAGAKMGRPRAGWRWTAHAGVAGTLLLNAMAARSLSEVPWHVTAPAVWSVLAELAARELLGQWRVANAALGEKIPLRLWLTAPGESARTWLRIARRLTGEQAAARQDAGLHAAAAEALKLALPGRGDRRVRRILHRQLRAGSLRPEAILGPLGWIGGDALAEVTGQAVLRAALCRTLATVHGTPDRREEVTTAASQQDEEAEPPAADRPGVRGIRNPSRPRTARARAGNASPSVAVILAYVDAHPDQSRKDVAASFGVNVRTVQRALATRGATLTRIHTGS